MTPLHEFLHALGVKHEETRYDRDDHVIVHLDNIDPTKVNLFNLDNPTNYDIFGNPYDIGSLMHNKANVSN